MPDWMDYVILTLLALLIVMLAVMFFLKPKKAEEKDRTVGLSKEDYDKIASLENKITNIENTVPREVRIAMGESQIKVIEKQNESEKKLSSMIEEKLKEVSKSFTENLQSSSQTIQGLTEKIGSIVKAQENLSSLESNILDLKSVLSNYSQRGAFGEVILETIIRSVFGEEVTDVYEFQKTLSNGSRPDAVIHVPSPDFLLCVDSKFLAAESEFITLLRENDAYEKLEKVQGKFGKDVLAQVQKISSSYIIPGETAGYAIMFIPSDGIFFFMHTKMPGIIQKAAEMKVYVASPSTLQPMLTTIRMVNRDYKRSELAKTISKNIAELGVQFRLFDEKWKDFAGNVAKVNKGIEELDSRARLMIRAFEKIKNTENGQIGEKINDVIDNI